MQKAQQHHGSDGDISTLLRAWTDGDQDALQKLTPIVYDELHQLAQRYMKRERAGHSLQTTALVNEAYMRLVDYKRMQWQNRAHFFAVSSQLMRRILVVLDDAMNALARIDPRKVQVVEMRFFGGLSVEETTEVLKISAVTVMRDWSTAKAWLYRELSSGRTVGRNDGIQSLETSR